MRSEAFIPAAVAFEREVATRLRSDCPQGWIAHDVYVGEEQIDVLAVLPHGIFAIECKAYHGQIVGDPNSAWLAHTNGRTTVLAPRPRNPYRQVLRKAFAIGDFLTAVLQANNPSSTRTSLDLCLCGGPSHDGVVRYPRDHCQSAVCCPAWPGSSTAVSASTVVGLYREDEPRDGL